MSEPNGHDIPPGTPTVLIAVLMTYERHGWPHPKILDFFYHLRENKNYATAYVPVFNWTPAASGRNAIAKEFKDSGASWVMMLDNDMSPPINVLDSIKDAPKDASVVVPRFHIWHPEANERTGRTKLCWGGLEGYAQDADHVRLEGKTFYEITKCGTGCIFIRPEVFQKIACPWFEYRYNEIGSMQWTEDITFCEKIRAAGLKIYGNALIEVGHHHTVNLATLDRTIHGGVDFTKGSCANTSVPETAERSSDEFPVVAAV